MCEIITIAMAVIFSAVWLWQNKKGGAGRSVSVTALLFWGAALMWSVDCVVSSLEGEPFFDLSKEDALLGAIIASLGLLIFAVSTVLLRFRPGDRSNLCPSV